ncbi:hypothetical protein AAMO2058_001707200 [Amorphochlora amoebiformis]
MFDLDSDSFLNSSETVHFLQSVHIHPDQELTTPIALIPPPGTPGLDLRILQRYYVSSRNLETHWSIVEDLYRKEHPFGLKILTRKQAIKRLFDWFDIDCSGTLKNAEMRRLINYTTAETEAHIIMDDYSKLQLAAGDPPESEGISLRGLDTLYKKDYGDLGEDWNTVKAHTPQISLGPGGVVLRYPKPHIHTRPVSRYQPASYPPDPISRISFLVHLFLEKSGNVLLDHLKFPREIYPSPDDPTGERLEPREFRRWQSWEGFQNVLTSKHESGLYDNQLFLTQKEIAEALVPDARDMLSHCWKAYDSNQDSCIDYNEYIQIPEGLRLKEVIAQNFPRLSSPKNESSFNGLNDSEISINIDKISEPIDLTEFQIPRNIPHEPRDIFQNSLEIPGDSPGVPQNSIKITRDSSQNLGDPLEIPGDSFEIPGSSEFRGKSTCGMAGKDIERGREQRICGGDLEKVSVDWEILEILSRFDDNYDGILTYTEFWPHYQERKNSGDMDTSAEAYTDPTDYRKFRAAKLKLEKWEKWRCLKENRPPKPQPQSMPRRVHQTWKSVKTVPVEVIPWMVSWVEKNPGWKHVFWSDEDNRLLVKQKLPFILPVFDLLKPVEQADIARNLYLYFFGGIYADMDFEAIKPLNHLQSHLAQNRATGFVGQEPRAHTRLLENRMGLLVSNAILGSAAGQLFWLALVARIILGLITESRQDPVSSTGPRILTSTYIMYYCLDPTAHSVAQFPPDLLCSVVESLCISPEAYVLVRSRFAKSFSAISIGGYILGIGDRHLNNIMLRKTDGQLVAIDFGYSFGQGNMLAIPELVPFRMTNQFRNLLRPLDSDGLIAEDMTRMLRELRNHRDVLLSVLDVFVHEPLLEWEQEAAKQDVKKGDTSWYPKAKVKIARMKLEGEHPSTILLQEIKQHRSWRNDDFRKCYANLIKGVGTGRVRSKKGFRRCDTVREQVDYLVDLATDPEILGRVWIGWNAFV